MSKRRSGRKNIRRKPLSRCACRQCSAEFDAANPRAGFCSTICASRFYHGRRKVSHTCLECGVGFHSRQTVARFCSMGCQNAASVKRNEQWLSANDHPSRIHASRADALRLYSFKRRAAYQSAAEHFSYEEIFERDGWLCQICTEEVDGTLAWPHPRSASLDHIIPIARGGAHEPSNVQCAHLGCNSSKGSKLRWRVA